MKCRIKIEGDVLEITFFDVEDTEQARGRECRIELALLRYYSRHRSEAVQRAADGKLIFRYIRGDSKHEHYMECRKIISEFQVPLVSHYPIINLGE